MSIYHKHHIIPKHMGGTDEPSNLVSVTVEQHANLHKQLWEEFGNWEDKLAWKGLSGAIEHDEIIRMLQSIGGKKGGKFWSGKSKSEEQKKKMSLSKLGKPRDEITKEKIRKGNRKKVVSEETRQKIKDSRIGTKHSKETKEKIAASMRLKWEK